MKRAEQNAKGLTKDDKKRLNCPAQCCNMIVGKTQAKAALFLIEIWRNEDHDAEKTLEGIDMFSGFRHKRKERETGGNP